MLRIGSRVGTARQGAHVEDLAQHVGTSLRDPATDADPLVARQHLAQLRFRRSQAHVVLEFAQQAVDVHARLPDVDLARVDIHVSESSQAVVDADREAQEAEREQPQVSSAGVGDAHPSHAEGG